MLWLSAHLAAAPGSRQCWHHLMHPDIFTEMTASHHCPSLKWKWASTTASVKGLSATLSECFLQRKVSVFTPYNVINYKYYFKEIYDFTLSFSAVFIIHDQSCLEPSKAPSRVWARTVSATEIEVYWEPIPPGSSSGKIIAYEVWKRKKLKIIK